MKKQKTLTKTLTKKVNTLSEKTTNFTQSQPSYNEEHLENVQTKGTFKRNIITDKQVTITNELLHTNNLPVNNLSSKNSHNPSDINNISDISHNSSHTTRIVNNSKSSSHKKSKQVKQVSVPRNALYQIVNSEGGINNLNFNNLSKLSNNKRFLLVIKALSLVGISIGKIPSRTKPNGIDIALFKLPAVIDSNDSIQDTDDFVREFTKFILRYNDLTDENGDPHPDTGRTNNNEFNTVITSIELNVNNSSSSTNSSSNSSTISSVDNLPNDPFIEDSYLDNNLDNLPNDLIRACKERDSKNKV